MPHVESFYVSYVVFFYQLFFFTCYTAGRDLHSFPTRRSSDLLLGLPHVQRAGDTISAPGFGEPQAVGGDRSEEHTSELQSPCNLVCRLLLEKKKKRH